LRKAPIDFDFTERSLADIVSALKRGERVKMPLAERASEVEALNDKPGGHKGNRNASKNDVDKKENINVVSHGKGTSAIYRIAKLKRDHPKKSRNRQWLGCGKNMPPCSC